MLISAFHIESSDTAALATLAIGWHRNWRFANLEAEGLFDASVPAGWPYRPSTII